MATPKKFRINIKKAIQIGSALFILSATVLYFSLSPYLSRQNDLKPAAMTAAKANLSVNVQLHLRTKNWSAVKSDLEDAKLFPLALGEIQNQVRSKKISAEDQEQLFGILIHFMQNKRSPREWNLLTRCLSIFDLKKEQSLSLRQTIEKYAEKRLQRNYLLQAFIGTLPYPMDLQKKITHDLLARDISQAREALYFLSMLKDTQASELSYLQLLKSYSSIHPKMKPLVLKNIFYSHNETLLKDPHYLQAKKDARHQTGDAWDEVKLAFQSQ